MQYDIINNEERDIKYTIYVTVDDVVYRDSTVVRPGKRYTYIHHIYPAQLEKGKLIFALYEEGKETPLEQVTAQKGVVGFPFWSSWHLVAEHNPDSGFGSGGILLGVGGTNHSALQYSLCHIPTVVCPVCLYIPETGGVEKNIYRK